MQERGTRARVGGRVRRDRLLGGHARALMLGCRFEPYYARVPEAAGRVRSAGGVAIRWAGVHGHGSHGKVTCAGIASLEVSCMALPTGRGLELSQVVGNEQVEDRGSGAQDPLSLGLYTLVSRCDGCQRGRPRLDLSTVAPGREQSAVRVSVEIGRGGRSDLGRSAKFSWGPNLERIRPQLDRAWIDRVQACIDQVQAGVEQA